MKQLLTTSLFVSSFLLSAKYNPVNQWKSLYDVPHFSAQDRTMLATELYYLMKETPTNNRAIDASFDEFYALRKQCTHPAECVNALLKAYEQSFVACCSQKDMYVKNRCWRTSLLSFYRTVAPEHEKIPYGVDAGKELPSAQLIEEILNWRPQPTHTFFIALQQKNNAFFIQCSITHRI